MRQDGGCSGKEKNTSRPQGKTVRQITEVLGGETPDQDRLLDAEIIELIDDETGLADEIEQADTYKESLYECVLKINRLLNATPPKPPDAPTTTPVALPTDPWKV